VGCAQDLGDRRLYRPILVALTAGGGFLLLAEVLAINAAITGEPDRSARLIVSSALLGVSVLTVLIMLAPWVHALPRRQWRAAWVGIALPLLLVGVVSVDLLDSAVRLSSVQERLEKVEAAEARLQTVDQQINEVGGDLVRLLGSEDTLPDRGLERRNAYRGFKLEFQFLQAKLRALTSEQRRLRRDLVEAGQG
jgi:hypothetical protein